MAIIDPVLVAELGGIVTSVTQVIKHRPLMKKIDGELIAGFVGAIIGLGWFVLSNGTDLVVAFMGIANGIMAGIGASTVFNIQKALPTPNILPTRGEKDVGEIVGESPPFTQTPEPVVEKAIEALTPNIVTEGSSQVGGDVLPSGNVG